MAGAGDFFIEQEDVENMKHLMQQVAKWLIRSARGSGFVWLFSVIAAGMADAAMLTDLQYWFAPDHIQTILYFDQAVTATYHHRSSPDRFVLEIRDCQDLQGGRTLPVDDVILQRIRVQRLGDGTLQVVFDLSQQVESTVQMLPSVNGLPDRVIVNLFDPVVQETVAQQQVEIHEMTEQFKENQYYILVIDPGHGGRDPGAVGPSGLKEKDVVLDLARLIKKMLERAAPQIKVYLTRDGDYFLTLPKRTEIANDHHADLFISLHANANPSGGVHGFSVYTLSENASDESAKHLAEQENAADILFGGLETPTPTDADSLLTFVLADLSTTSDLQRSLEFGQLSMTTAMANLKKYQVQKEGLKRANFNVLRSANMSAVLVEGCYISNKREEKLLAQKDFRETIARSLADSIQAFFAKPSDAVKPQVAQRMPQPAQTAGNAAAEAYKVHVVKNGESLSLIAGRYDVSLTQLRQINQLASADMIYAGQRLWIP